MSYQDMQALEASLTPEQLDYAMALMRSNGWHGEAPEWCWRMAFYEAMKLKPSTNRSDPWHCEHP